MRNSESVRTVCSSPKADTLLFSNALYPLRIIGLNQDEKASGGMAGLTFLFTQPMKTDTVTYSVGEGQPTTSWETSNARTWLNSGQGWTGLPAGVRGAIKQVKKISVRGDMGWGDRSTWQIINTVDSVFFLSFKELSTRATVANEPIGVGADKTECYLVVAAGAVTNPEGDFGGKSWERDYNSQNQFTYAFNNSVGAPTWIYGSSPLSYRPAFCF